MAVQFREAPHPKHGVEMTRLNCHRFWSNEVRLWLSVLAHNLGNLWRLVKNAAIVGCSRPKVI
jgi:hypothetical protein